MTIIHSTTAQRKSLVGPSLVLLYVLTHTHTTFIVFVFVLTKKYNLPNILFYDFSLAVFYELESVSRQTDLGQSLWHLRTLS